jgi:hypothetical protein
MYKLLALFFLLSSPSFSNAQKQYPEDVEAVLRQTPQNRAELERAIEYFLKQGDSLKIKAIYFLIGNMDIHNSVSYYWADSLGKRLSFNELDYPNFQSSIKGLDDLKKNHGQVKPVPETYRDINSITGDYLINNIERAFQVWRTQFSLKVSFDHFCEYILPYRISVEPLQSWRDLYFKKFDWINDSARGKTTKEAIQFFAADYNKWFTNTYKIEGRNEPLPRLGALQLLHRKKGPCEDIADLQVFTLRSQGIPASLDQVPAWATSSGKHFLNVAFTPEMSPVSFDVSTELVTDKKLNREPAKVIRSTYSKQKNVLASLINAEDIPEGFLRTLNYKDVTKEYWETADVKPLLFKKKSFPEVVFACVFNFSQWKPVWWSKVDDGKANFTDMCKGAVFLPMYYINHKLVPAGFPIASGYNNTVVLQPDTIAKKTIRIQAEERYLAFRAGKKYTLYYWDSQWKPLGVKTAASDTRELLFNNVPSNALLLLRPEYSQNKERPFIITKNNERLWW